MSVIAFMLMLLIVGWCWCRKSGDWVQSVLLSLWICAVYWLNAPNYLSVIPGTEIQSDFFSVPLRLYQQLGQIYVVLCNLLLAMSGVLVGRQWERKKKYRQKEMKHIFDCFVSDATELKIIGRNMKFLLDEKYKGQKEVIEKLGRKAQLLCAVPEDQEMIQLYNDLMNRGIQVRAYSNREGIENLKGQIKTDGHKREIGIFTYKNIEKQEKMFSFLCRKSDTFFDLTELSDGYLVEAVSRQFDRSFRKARNPVIRCIAFDLGGVYLKGDLDDFYKYIADEFQIQIPKKKEDRLNISESMMKGETDIRQYLMEVSDKMNGLKDTDWKKIYKKWENTWSPNDKMKQLLEQLAEDGYEIVAFSNLDRRNGDKYIRESYLPSCCTHYFFSYEKKVCKPTKQAFQEFSKYAKESAGIFFDCQILLIDDQRENISTAAELGWKTICYSNKEPMEKLLKDLRRVGLLEDEIQ